jgi:nucleoside-diphosphate-sugar epimerase
MAMPDAVDALLALAAANPDRLTRTAYNLSAFSPTADAVRQQVVRAFPASRMTWDVDAKRQAIIDSWPESVDDAAARSDWGFAPRFSFESAFDDYLIPTIKERYAR